MSYIYSFFKKSNSSCSMKLFREKKIKEKTEKILHEKGVSQDKSLF